MCIQEEDNYKQSHFHHGKANFQEACIPALSKCDQALHVNLTSTEKLLILMIKYKFNIAPSQYSSSTGEPQFFGKDGVVNWVTTSNEPGLNITH